MLADLRWLGLHWDEGPDMKGCKYGPYRQSERSDIYIAAAQRLIEQGKAYRCFATEEELEELFTSNEDGDTWASVQISDPSLILNEEWDRGDCWRYIRNGIVSQMKVSE